MDHSESISNTLSRELPEEEFSLVRASLEDAASRKPDSISNEEIRKGDRILETYTVLGDAIHGGMGSVWRVRHESWNTDLAMKRPQPRFFAEGSEKRKEEFIRECENWINLGLHPNIVSCFYVREIGGVPAIFSEWMEGGSLKDCIRDGSLYRGTEAEAAERILDIAIQAARGLQYSHECGLVHQDMKPGNLLLNGNREAKVADFGLAKAQGKLTENSRPGSSGYTVQYCPKEQADGAAPEKWMDVYAWALTVLEMYLGERLWETGAEAKDRCAEYSDRCRIPIPAPVREILAGCLSGAVQDFTGLDRRLTDAYREITGREYRRPIPKAAADTADSLNNRALSFLDLNQPGKAEACWEEALAREPGHLVSGYNYGLVQWREDTIRDTELMRRCDPALFRGSMKQQAERLLAQVNAERGVDMENARVIELPPGENKPSIVPDAGIKRIYSAGCGFLHCFDADTSECLYTVQNEDFDDILGLTEDGKLLVVEAAGKKNAFYVILAETGETLRAVPAPASGCYCTASCLHPDSRRIYIACDRDTIFRWDLTTGELTGTYRFPPLHFTGISGIAVCSDLKTLYVYSYKQGYVFLWDEDRQVRTDMRRIPGRRGSEKCFFDRENDLLYLLCYDYFIRVYSIKEYEMARDRAGDPCKALKEIASYEINASALWTLPDRTSCLIEESTVTDGEASYGDNYIHLWDLSRERHIVTFAEWGPVYFREIFARPDLSLVAIGDDRETDHVNHRFISLYSAVRKPVKAPWELSVVSGYEETYAEQQEKAMFLQKIGSALEKEKYEEAVELLEEAESRHDPEPFWPFRRKLDLRCRKTALTGVVKLPSVRCSTDDIQAEFHTHPESGKDLSTREYTEREIILSRALYWEPSFRGRMESESADGRIRAKASGKQIRIIPEGIGGEEQLLSIPIAPRDVCVSDDGAMLCAMAGETIHVWGILRKLEYAPEETAEEVPEKEPEAEDSDEVILVTDEPAPLENKEDPVPEQEWDRIRELFADELKALRKSLPVKSRLFSRVRIEPVKYNEDREVILLRTSVEERNGRYHGGAAVLDLENGAFHYQNPTLFFTRDPERPGRNLARNILDLNGAGWHLLIGDRGNLYLYDIADRTEKVLPEAGSFAFGAFLEDGRQVLCHRGNTVFVFDAESGKLRGKKEFPGAIDRVYLTGGNTFAAVRGTSAVLCRVKPVPRAPE